LLSSTHAHRTKLHQLSPRKPSLNFGGPATLAQRKVATTLDLRVLQSDECFQGTMFCQETNQTFWKLQPYGVVVKIQHRAPALPNWSVNVVAG